MDQPPKVPAQAWVVTLAGTAVNLCLGILYAWSVWKAELVAREGHPAGSAMTGLNAGWSYLTDAQGTWAYAICGFVFALFMIPGGRLQDRYGPKVGATLGGLFLAAGCILAGLMKSYGSQTIVAAAEDETARKQCCQAPKRAPADDRHLAHRCPRPNLAQKGRLLQ